MVSGRLRNEAYNTAQFSCTRSKLNNCSECIAFVNAPPARYNDTELQWHLFSCVLVFVGFVAPLLSVLKTKIGY